MNFDQSIAALQTFITDFNLKDKSGIVNFNGTIHLLMDGHLSVFESNVQIITSHHIDTVYIIHGREKEDRFPEMFDPRSFYFSYVKREGLRITPINKNLKIIASIYPRPV